MLESGKSRSVEKCLREMSLRELMPFVGMFCVQFIQVILIVAIKEATSDGMTKITFVFYSNALAALFLLPISFFTHRCELYSNIYFYCHLGIISQNKSSSHHSLTPLQILLAWFTRLDSTSNGDAAIQITPTAFVSALLNLIPGFTFVLAVIFRMEEVDFRSTSTLAKVIGTLVSILGALIATLYVGPAIFSTTSLTNAFQTILAIDNNLLQGGLLLIIDCLAASAFVITQTLVLKEFGAELIIVFFYCFFVVVLTALYSLIVERDPLSAWSLQSPVRLLAILYSGIIGSAAQVSISTWCVRKKGPVFVAVFHPFGIVIAAVVGIIFLGDILYMGSLVGSLVIVIGFYSVMWGKAKELKSNKDSLSSLASTSEETPLLQNIKDKGAQV